jgi:hypothetical protein
MPRQDPSRERSSHQTAHWLLGCRPSHVIPVQVQSLAGAEASSRTACQYSGGISSPGPGVGTFPRTAVAFARFSNCFEVGVRQLAGRSVILRCCPN